MVSGSLHKYGRDRSSVSGRREWHECNKNINNPERGSIYLRHPNSHWRLSCVDADKFSANRSSWRSCIVRTNFLNLKMQTLTSIRTSPTAYNVFTGMTYQQSSKITFTDIYAAYSITSAYSSNGICVTTSGSAISVSPAYSEVLVSANGQVTLDANGQQSFIDHLGFSSCSGGGENIGATALVQVLNTTATTTSTFSNVPLAAVVASLTIAPVSILPTRPNVFPTEPTVFLLRVSVQRNLS